MPKSGVYGPQRLLHALAKFDEEYPVNKEGRVDIKNLTRLLMLLTEGDGEYHVKEHDKQYFTKDAELRDHITEVNNRLYKKIENERDIDAVAAGRIASVNKRAKEAQDQAVTARADYAEVLQRLTESERKVADLTRENQSLREQMELIRSGIMPQVK